MKCIIAHEVPVGDGKFKIFEAGRDYPADETTGREHYFAPAEKITEEVRKYDAD